MKVYVVLVENCLFGGIIPEVFSTKRAAELSCPGAEIEECVVDETFVRRTFRCDETVDPDWE